MIAVDTCVVVPWAQFGTQLWIPLVPSPTAWFSVQDDQLIPVTMFPPSPLKSISEGLIPAQSPAISVGSAPPAVV